MTKRKRKPVIATADDLLNADRKVAVEAIMRQLSRAKIKALVEFSLETMAAAREFRVGELEGIPAFIRRLGASFRAHCPHAFETNDPRCLRCGEPNEAYIPPAGEADATLPPSSEVH